MALHGGSEHDRSPRVARGRLRAVRNRHRDDEVENDSSRDESWSRSPVEAPGKEREREQPQSDPEQKPPEQRKEPPKQEKEGGGQPPSRGWLHRHPLWAAVGILAILLVGCGIYVYWEHTSHFETTDDAFIAARQFAIAPKVGGYITDVPVTDNQHVDARAVIARIDDRDYRAALAQSDAQVQSAEANVRNIDAQSDVQHAQIAESKANLEQSRASLVFAQEQANRYADLAKTGAGTVQNAQQYTSSLDQQRASLKTAESAVTAAQLQLTTLAAQRGSADASVAQANAQRDQARLNLSYTTVTAAQAGRVVQLGAGVGEYAAAGTNLTIFVPDDIWITANFKETQLDKMRPGQPVTLSIDAYPEREIRGHVASVQPGSGTAFSLLPAQNATGNYVKIVQRVPVKIILDDVPTDVALGPGMSVEPSVRVDPAPSLYERWRHRR